MATQGPNIGTQSMISMSNVVVTGGNFTQHIAVSGRKAAFDILKEAAAHTAFHDSGAHFDTPKCHPNTRVAVLDKIMNWVRLSDSETRGRLIMWLTGAAGAGKSAIAQSFIEMCLIHGLVIASFFFGRSDSSRNHAGSFIATLAYQVIQAVPAARQEILDVIDADPLILTKGLRQQFTQLIAHPLHGACSSNNTWPTESYRVIVIDGLDECVNVEARQNILRTISNAALELNLPILFLIASRPEHDISVEFASREMKNIFTRVYLDDNYKPDEDIYRYLHDSFVEIRDTHPFRSRIPPIWPTPQAVQTIVQKASGQFIYAATVIRFVQSIRHQPHYQLDVVRNLRPAEGDLPFAHLDALYTKILSSAVDIKRVLYALSVYSHRIFKDSRFNISEFMSLDAGELDILFCDLGALVSIERSTLRILHASVHDFLLDEQRSKDYFIDIEKYRTQHVHNILRHVLPDISLTREQMEARVPSIYDFSRQNFPLCRSSAQLLGRADYFPVEKFRELAIADRRHAVSKFIFSVWLPFLKRMAQTDQRWLVILQRLENRIDQIFLSIIPDYHAYDSLRTLLCLLCHSEKEQLVSLCKFPIKDPGIINNYGRLFHGIYSIDPLGLSTINLNHVGTYDDQYRQCVIRFLQDPKRSGKYAIEGYTYAKAASFFLHRLQEVIPLYGDSTTDEEEISSRLVQKENIGKISFHGGDRKAKEVNFGLDIFLLLCYIILFLSRSGASEQLVQQVEDYHHHSVLQAKFPRLDALLHQAIRNYLERAGDQTAGGAPEASHGQSNPVEAIPNHSIPVEGPATETDPIESTPQASFVEGYSLRTSGNESNSNQGYPANTNITQASIVTEHSKRRKRFFSKIFTRK